MLQRGVVASDADGSASGDLERGTNQLGVRLYNERLVLSLIRSHGSMAKAQLARLTGLSPQTISVIMNQLEADGLVLRRKPQRGRVGQPSVPLALNPDGAFSLGLKFGRRSSDLLLMDFAGNVRWMIRETYAYPLPATLTDFVARGIATLRQDLTAEQVLRVRGLGIAAPFELWNWEEALGAPRSVIEAWRRIDTAASVAAVCPWPVHFCNDATAACAAEVAFGRNGRYLDYYYVFIGAFVGGGVVLNGSLYPGRNGNAGALSSMPPIGRRVDAPGIAVRGAASLYVLERMLAERGHDPTGLARSPDDWTAHGEVLDAWIEGAAEALALAFCAIAAVIDFQAIVIDGAVPTMVRRKLIERTQHQLDRLDRQGISPFDLVEGTIGSNARAIGAASLPLMAGFSRDPDVLFKERT